MGTSKDNIGISQKEISEMGGKTAGGFIIFTCRVFLGKFAVHMGPPMKFKYHRMSRCLRSRRAIVLLRDRRRRNSQEY